MHKKITKLLSYFFIFYFIFSPILSELNYIFDFGKKAEAATITRTVTIDGSNISYMDTSTGQIVNTTFNSCDDIYYTNCGLTIPLKGEQIDLNSVTFTGTEGSLSGSAQYTNNNDLKVSLTQKEYVPTTNNSKSL